MVVHSPVTEEEPSDQQSKLSVTHSTAVDILQRCSHHLASPSLHLKIEVLASLQECLWVLKGEQQALLPEVHKVWPAFLCRLGDDDPLVATKALDVLLAMTKVCGDFLRRRVVQGVWPSLIRQLETLAKTSAQSNKHNRYVYYPQIYVGGPFDEKRDLMHVFKVSDDLGSLQLFLTQRPYYALACVIFDEHSFLGNCEISC